MIKIAFFPYGEENKSFCLLLFLPQINDVLYEE